MSVVQWRNSTFEPRAKISWMGPTSKHSENVGKCHWIQVWMSILKPEITGKHSEKRIKTTTWWKLKAYRIPKYKVNEAQFLHLACQGRSGSHLLSRLLRHWCWRCNHYCSISVACLVSSKYLQLRALLIDGEVTIVQFRRVGRILNLFLYVSEAIIYDRSRLQVV